MVDCKPITAGKFRPACLSSRRRGLSLIESVLSLLILGGAFVALLNTVGSARSAQAIAAERQFGYLLAEDLLSEALSQQMYQEGITFGPEADEVLGNRSGFDDIDDYHKWYASPPVDRYGVEIPGSEGYSRQVSVNYRQRANTNRNAASDEGVLQVMVTVKRGDKTIVTLRGLRTDVWQPPEEGY